MAGTHGGKPGFHENRIDINLDDLDAEDRPRPVPPRERILDVNVKRDTPADEDAVSPVYCPRCKRLTARRQFGEYPVCPECVAAIAMEQEQQRADAQVTFSTPCPKPRCRSLIPIRLDAAAELQPLLCQGCRTKFDARLGRVRSKDTSAIDRGGPTFRWQIRYYKHPDYRQEGLLTFEAPREVELASRDDFYLIYRSGIDSPVQIGNRKLNTVWGMWPSGGCLLALLLLPYLMLTAPTGR